MSIAFGGIVSFLFRGANLVVALAILLLLSRVLSKAEVGTVQLGITTVGIVNAATGGLTAATGVQISSKRRLEGLALSNGGVLGLGLGALAIIAGFVAGALFAGDAQREVIAVGFACAAVILSGVVAGTFLGREAFVRYNLALVAPPFMALALITIAFFVFDVRRADVTLEMYALGQWLAIVLLLVTAGPTYLRGLAFRPEIVAEIARFAFLAGLASGVSYLNYRADVFLVVRFDGKEAVATYSFALYIAESVWQVSGSLALATYARLGGTTREAAVALTTRVMRHTILLLVALCAVLFLAADLIQRVLFPGYDGMASAMRLLLPGVLIYSLAQSFSGYYTWQRGMPWVSAVVAGAALCLDVILALVLIPRFGIEGAAAASSIAKSVAIIVAIAVFVRSERIPVAQVFRFGQADIDDYRSLLGRVRGRIAVVRGAPADR